MKKLSPAEDAEMFVKAAEYVSNLDPQGMVEFMNEVYMNSMNVEILAEMEVAIDTVWANIEETENENE
jgi:hypothetical protein